MIGEKDKRLHLISSGIFFVVLIWSFIGSHNFNIWATNSIPIVIGYIFMVYIYRKFKFTRLVYTIILIASVIIFIASRYTFSQEPVFNWLKEVFHFSRNHYDRFGHFFQGPTVAFIARELLVRKSPLKSGKWLYFVSLCVSMAAGAVNEFVEWGATAYSHQGINYSYIDAQGDIFDAQWDMFMSFIGANISLLLLSRYHDKLLKD